MPKIRFAWSSKCSWAYTPGQLVASLLEVPPGSHRFLRVLLIYSIARERCRWEVTDTSETVIRIWTLIGSSSLESLARPPTQPSKSVGRTGILSHRLPPKIPTLGSGFPCWVYFVVITFLVDGGLINKTRVSKTWLNFKHKVTS